MRSPETPRLIRGPLSMADLIQAATNVDHSGLRQELASTGRIVINLTKRGRHTAAVTPLRKAFLRLCDEVEANLEQEETVLFPALIANEKALRAGQPLPVHAFGSVRNPISMMEQSHARIRALLDEMRSQTEDYSISDPNCEMLGLFIRALSSLDVSLREHLDHEDKEIFQQARRLEGSAPKSPDRAQS